MPILLLKVKAAAQRSCAGLLGRLRRPSCCTQTGVQTCSVWPPAYQASLSTTEQLWALHIYQPHKLRLVWQRLHCPDQRKRCVRGGARVWLQHAERCRCMLRPPARWDWLPGQLGAMAVSYAPGGQSRPGTQARPDPCRPRAAWRSLTPVA